jgi:hypothetical protein
MIQKVLIIEDEKPNADRLERLIKSIRLMHRLWMYWTVFVKV